MTGDEQTRVGAYAICLDEADRILLCRIVPSIAPGKIWTLPGGGLDFGESPATAVVRELAEESGYIGEVIELVDVSDHLFTSATESGAEARFHAIRIVYLVRIVGGDLRDEVGGSTDTCAWFTLEAAARLRLGELARRALRLVPDLARPQSA